MHFHFMHFIPCISFHAFHSVRFIPCDSFHAFHTMHSYHAFIPCNSFHVISFPLIRPSFSFPCTCLPSISCHAFHSLTPVSGSVTSKHCGSSMSWDMRTRGGDAFPAAVVVSAARSWRWYTKQGVPAVRVRLTPPAG
jgi:hypothetical protein